MDNNNNNKVDTDWVMFAATAATILLLCVPMAGFHEQSGKLITQAYDAITQQFGILYLWYGSGAVIFLAWLAISHYGNVKLGDADSTPEFATHSWVGMLFCAGVGAGLLYWAVIEWGYYINTPLTAWSRAQPKLSSGRPATGCFTGVSPAGQFFVCLPSL